MGSGAALARNAARVVARRDEREIVQFATVTAVAGALVQIRPTTATTAGVEQIARVAGPVPQVGDRVLFAVIAGETIVFGKIAANNDAAFGAISAAGDLTAGKHVIAGGSAPAFSAGGAAGSTASVAGSEGTDACGMVQVVPGGTGIAAGTILTITFALAMPSAKFACVLTPASNAARSLGGVVGPTGRTTAKVDLDTRTALTSGQTYQWVYWIASYG